MKRSAVSGLLALLSLFAFVLQGYHPGAEDDGVYLSAIKRDLKPSLYPYNSEFFTLQMQATIFDKSVAASVRATHLPVAYVCLGWQLAAIGLLLAGCWRIAGLVAASSHEVPPRLRWGHQGHGSREGPPLNVPD